MANPVLAGRFTANRDQPLVVFLIGMRINRFWRIDKWLPVARAMPPMIAELTRDSDSGFLGGEFMLMGMRTLAVFQYWRDFDSLEHYARSRDRQHWPAWTAFNKAVGTSGTVGIFHETYSVAAGAYETIYANMPRMGLGAVNEVVPASGSRAEARLRMKGAQNQS